MNYNYVEKIQSTNQFIKENIDEIPDWYILRAGEQTSGRGRYDRVWYCEKSKDIAMSVLMPFFPNLMQIIAVSVVQTIESFVLTQIKWPNDILVGGKKICGILLNGVSMGEKTRVVAGIGLNVNSSRKKQDGINATSLFDETGNTFDLDDLAKNIAKNIIENSQKGFGEFVGILNEKLAYKNEKRTVIDGEKRITGTILEIDENGELVLQAENGVRKFISGEIIQ